METPPVRITASADSSAVASAAASTSASSVACRCATTSIHGRAPRSDASTLPLLSRICHGAGVRSVVTNSSPVVMIATRTRRWTRTQAAPNVASAPIEAAPMSVPGCRISAPFDAFSPTRRMNAPGCTALAAICSSAHPLAMRTSSCRTTASAPIGIGAPVTMRIA